MKKIHLYGKGQHPVNKSYGQSFAPKQKPREKDLHWRNPVHKSGKETVNMQAIRMVLPALLLATTASFAQDVRYNFADKQDFSKYKTYRWVDVKGADHLDQIADQQLKTAIDAEMAKKGLSRTENDKSDLYLGYQVALGQEKQFTSYDTGWGYGPGWGGYYGGGGGMTTTTSTTIHTGQLGLDIYDTAEKQLVWRGTASKTLDPKAKPEKREKNLRKAVTKLLKNYPPPPKKA